MIRLIVSFPKPGNLGSFNSGSIDTFDRSISDRTVPGPFGSGTEKFDILRNQLRLKQLPYFLR